MILETKKTEKGHAVVQIVVIFRRSTAVLFAKSLWPFLPTISFTSVKITWWCSCVAVLRATVHQTQLPSCADKTSGRLVNQCAASVSRLQPVGDL